MKSFSMPRLLSVIFLFVVFVAVVFSLWLWQEKENHLETPLNLSSNITLTIENGSNLKEVLFDLHERDVLSTPYFLLFEARCTKKAELIKAGEFEIATSTTPRQLLEQLINGKVVQYSITLVEGWNYRQVLKAVRDNEELKQTVSELSVDEIMNRIGLSGIHPEGQFFPDTYYFPAGTLDVEFLKRANTRLVSILEEEWQSKSANLPYNSSYDALIMASIIEKETAAAEERDTISGVFIRRLNKQMKLQTDPTVIYAIGEKFDGDIRRKDLSIDSPYNTYLHMGLPPTPISMVGREAIHAALHPKQGAALYFVAMGNGRHYFSATLDEHNRAVRKYQLNK